MAPDALFWLAAAGLFVTGVASIGARTLHDFSISELEEYCQRRKRQDLFGEILDRHERVAFGAESLQVVGIAVFVLAGGLRMLESPLAEGQLSLAQLLGAAGVAGLLLLVAASWIPWAVKELWSAPVLARTWRLWRAVAFVLWPLSVGVTVVDALMRRMAGRHEEVEDAEEEFEDEIRAMVTAGEHEGLLEADAREMIEGVIELADTDVADIMTQRSNVDALDIELSWPELLAFVIEAGRTRLPVYERSRDNIVGVLFVKDLLPELAKPHESHRRHLRDFIREPWFIPKTKRVDELLRDFLETTRSHLAVVLDEYDTFAGVVTIEDVLEEIVGEIVDESDKEELADIMLLDDSTADVLGTAHIDELNEELGVDLPESDEFDTIAGLVVDSLGRIPKPGESLQHGNVQIDVVQASKRKVERVRVAVLDKANGKPAAPST